MLDGHVKFVNTQHLEHLGRELSAQLSEGRFSDLSIISSNGTFRCHKLLLGRSSRRLSSLYSSLVRDISIGGEDTRCCKLCFRPLSTICNSAGAWSELRQSLEEADVIFAPDATPVDIESFLRLLCLQKEGPGTVDNFLLDNCRARHTGGQAACLQAVRSDNLCSVETQQDTSGEFRAVCPTENGHGVKKRQQEKRKGGHVVCGTCGKSFKNARVLRMHKRLHTAPETAYCAECCVQFEWRSSLVEHQKAVHHAGRYSCETCGRLFAYLGNLRAHARSVHQDPKRNDHRCASCPVVCKSGRSLRQHERRHDPQLGSAFPCRRCPRGFPTRTELRRHELSHAEARQVLCDECPGRFSSKMRLASHYRSSHRHRTEDRGLGMCCPFCGLAQFCTWSDVIKHIKQSHANQREQNTDQNSEGQTVHQNVK